MPDGPVSDADPYAEAPPPGAEPPDAPNAGAVDAPVRWGLGDAAVGWFAAQIGGAIMASVALAASGADDFEELSLSWIALAQLGLWFGLLGVPLWAAWHKGRGPVRDYALRGTWRDLPLGAVVGAVTQYVVIPIVYIPIFLLSDVDVDELGEAARDLTDRATDPLGVALLVLIVGVGAPIIEEIFYRGLLQGALIRRFGIWPGVVVQAVVFAGSHFQPLQFPALLVFGLVLGYLTVRTERLLPAIAAHMVFNLVTVVALVGSS